MERILYLILFITALPFLSSCEKELDFEYHDIDPKLVIESSLTDSGIQVSLTNTTPMDQPMNTTRITDAVVTLTDLTTGQAVTLIADNHGYFVNDNAGILNHEYRIDVFRGDRHYFATGRMLQASRIDDIRFQWIKMPYDYVAALQVSFTDIGSDDVRYWVRVYRNGEAYSWSIYSQDHAKEGIINAVMMTSRKDTDAEDDKSLLVDGDVVKVTVTPISLLLSDYLIALEADSNGPRLFDGDFCLGYFSAAPVAETEIIYHPDQITEYK